MNKEIINDIKELIEFLLSIRERTILENEENSNLINSFSSEDTYDKDEELKIINNKFDKRLITLNNLLSKEEQNKEVLNIELLMKEMNNKIEQLSNNKKLTSEDIKVISQKEFINVREFEILFNRGKEAQSKYRRRVNNPLPTFSKGGKGVDTIYRRVDAEKWCSRYLSGYNP